MRAAALLLVALLLAGSARAGGDEVIFDVRGLLDAGPERRAPKLGLFLGGSRLWSASDVEEGERSGIDIEELADLLGAGDAGLSAGGFLSARGEAAAALASLGLDARRCVRLRVETTGTHGAGVSGEILARPGRFATLERTARRHLLLDSDVEVACDNSGGFRPSAIGDPISAAVFQGFAVDARPFLVDGGARVAFEALVQAGRIEEPVPRFRLGARWHGDLDLPSYRGVLLLCSGEGPTVAGVSARGGELAVRLDPVNGGEPGSGPARLFDAGLVRLPPGGPPEEEDPEAEGGAYLAWVRFGAPPLRRSSAPAGGPPGEWFIPGRSAGAAVAVAGAPEEIAAVSRAVAALTTPAARAVMVALTLWAGDEIVATAEIPVLDGREAVLRAGRDRMVVADYDVEVGCFTQVPDPIVVPLFEGLFVRARPRFAPGGAAVLLDLDLRLSLLDGEPVERPSGDPINGATHTVRVVERQTRVDLHLADGVPARLALGLRPDGRPLLAEVCARISH